MRLEKVRETNDRLPKTFLPKDENKMSIVVGDLAIQSVKKIDHQSSVSFDA